MNVFDIALTAYLRVAGKLRGLRENKDGVTAIEYGVIAALIIVVCVATIKLIGTDLNTAFSKVDSALK